MRITICDSSPDDPQKNEYAEEIERWSFSMQQHGYPDHITSLAEISPEFAKLNGASIQASFVAADTAPAAVLSDGGDK